MSRLVMVRHGQASFWSDQYDLLSPVGVEQSQLLGTQWGEARRRFARAYVGPRARHRDTYTAVAEAYARAGGVPMPPPEEVADFDEHMGQEVCAAHLPPPGDVSQDDQMARKAYMRQFAATLHGWASGEFPVSSLEPFTDFRARVDAAMRRVRSDLKSGEECVIFTSGGVISAAIGGTLRAADAETMELGWTLGNGSVTEFLASPTRLTLAAFNVTAHLTPELHTLI